MAKYRPSKGLEERIAAMIAPTVHDIAERVERTAAAYAPAVKEWRTQGDALVRREHRLADRQKRPANLRFKLESPRYDRGHYGVGAHQLLRFPRDPNGSPGLVINCRCYLAHTGELAAAIKAQQPIVSGKRVINPVTCDYEMAADSEFGTDEDPPARFLGRAAAEVAARL